MDSKVTIDKEELRSMIRSLIREELSKIETVSNIEQQELQVLYDSALEKSDYNKEDNIRL